LRGEPLAHLAQTELAAVSGRRCNQGGACVEHFEQQLARKRQIGDSGFGWSRKDSESDITPVTAATLALWGLTSGEIAEKPKLRSGKACFV
jgi:hypothetical protein